jgi:signal transduction histidine kinase
MRRRLASLRLRLLAGTLVWIVASIVVAGWGLGSLFRQHVEAQFHAELKTYLDQLAANLVLDAPERPALAAAPSDPRLAKPHSGLYWQIDSLPGGSAPARSGVLRSRSLWDSVLEVPPGAPADGEIHRHRTAGPAGAALGMIERTIHIDPAPGEPPQRLRLVVAADEQLMAAPIERFQGSLWLALGILGLGLVIAAVVQVAVGLAPLERLRTALAAVRDGGTQTLEGDFPAEIRPLVDEFNSVLAQNTEVVARARTQAGNLAHALKTPLTVLANAAAGQDGELARLVGEQVETARRQVDYHLKRARAAAAVRLPGSHTPLLPAVEGLARLMRRIHAERDLALEIRPMPENPAFRGERQDLEEMLGNLLDNACKWARHKVEVQAGLEKGALVVTLDDDGPGIAPERRPEMLGRGIRADEQVPGSGLGLAIVDDLARLYGGRLELADSPLGGLRARLILPAA